MLHPHRTRQCDEVRELFTRAINILELRLQNINLAQIYDSVSFGYSDFICSLYDAVPKLRILELGVWHRSNH